MEKLCLDDDLAPLVVIGAGPHALSLLCRLIEDEPDLFTEAERTQMTVKAGTGAKGRARPFAAVRKHLSRRVDNPLAGVRVLDAHGGWLTQWRLNFAALEIAHLRSHADLHPCPYDWQSLRVFAEKRPDELWHMQYLERDEAHAADWRGPFKLPDARLFLDFCDALVERYGLRDAVETAHVASVGVVPPAADGGACTFVVRLADGREIPARRVVCAAGPGHWLAGMRTNLPWWADDLLKALPAACADRVLHSSRLLPALAGEGGAAAKAALRGLRVLLIGGGQTAGHLALLALAHGARRVVVAARRRVRRKPFDIDLELMGDRRGKLLRAYAAQPPRDRLEHNRRVRGGGSMSPEIFAELTAHADGGRFELLEEVSVEDAEWVAAGDGGDGGGGGGGDGGGDDGGGGGGCVHVTFDDRSVGDFDRVWLATGGELDVSREPLLGGVLAQRPIEVVGGLPVLTDELAWDDATPLYVLGGFAQLQLGPDALNLAGARAGTVRVARALRPQLRS